MSMDTYESYGHRRANGRGRSWEVVWYLESAGGEVLDERVIVTYGPSNWEDRRDNGEVAARDHAERLNATAC